MSSPLLAKDWRDHRSILDPKELAARLRAITPDVEEQIEAMKCQSKLDRDTLIDLGGRPTRPIRTEPVSSSPVQRNRRGRKPKSGTGESLTRPAKVAKNTRQQQMIDPKTLTDQHRSLLVNAAASANYHSHAPPTSFDPHQQHATHHHKIATQNLTVRPDATPIRKNERIRHLAEQSLSATMAASPQHQKHYVADLPKKPPELSPAVESLRRSARLKANASSSPSSSSLPLAPARPFQDSMQ